MHALQGLQFNHGWATQEAIYQDRESIRSLIKARPLQDDFYDQTRHDSNLYDCYVRTRLLSILMSIDDSESAELAAADLRRKRWLWDDGIGYDAAYYQGPFDNRHQNINLYLSGLWPVVAILDPTERAPLLSALENGSVSEYPYSGNVYIDECISGNTVSISKNPQLADFIQSLGQTDFLQRDDTPRDQMVSHQ